LKHEIGAGAFGKVFIGEWQKVTGSLEISTFETIKKLILQSYSCTEVQQCRKYRGIQTRSEIDDVRFLTLFDTCHVAHAFA
jgi:hypothetical protein